MVAEIISIGCEKNQEEQKIVLLEGPRHHCVGNIFHQTTNLNNIIAVEQLHLPTITSAQ